MADYGVPPNPPYVEPWRIAPPIAAHVPYPTDKPRRYSYDNHRSIAPMKKYRKEHFDPANTRRLLEPGPVVLVR